MKERAFYNISTIQQLAESISNKIDAAYKTNNGEYRCNCPACGDTDKKLYISYGRNSRGDETVTLNCKKLCSTSDVLRMVGLEFSDLYLKNYQQGKDKGGKSKKNGDVDFGNVIREHIYTDENDKNIAKKTFYAKFSGGKSAISYHWEDGKWVAGLNGIIVPLYHVQQLKNNDTIYLPEGEKDCETLEKMGFCATTPITTWHNEYKEYLKDKNIIVLSDNDSTGDSKGNKAINFALKSDAKSVKLVSAVDIYPKSKNKWDISDIVEAVGTDAAKQMLIDAIKRTENITTINEQVKTTEYDKSGKLTIHNLETYLKNKGITVKYNVISHDIEFIGYSDGESPEHISETIIPIIYDDMQHVVKGCTTGKIQDFLNVIATRNKFNPVLEMLNKGKWDKLDRLQDIYELLQINDDDELSKTLLKKWFMQCICGLHNTDLINPYSLDIVLIFQGKQGAGKTRLFEHLAMQNRLFGEGVTIDPRNKDTHIQATSRWICELGEIGSTMKKDIDSLKAFLTLSTDTYRMPYGRKALEYNRMTSFCGTTNDQQFLIDETGNRRFATIPLDEDLYIDYDTQVKPFDSLQFWLQIAEIVETEIKQYNKSYASVFRLTREELNALNERNREFEKPLKGEEEVADVVCKLENMMQDTTKNMVMEYMTVTEFIQQNTELKGLNARQVGKILDKLGYPAIRKRIGGDVTRVRRLPHWKGAGIKVNYTDVL